MTTTTTDRLQPQAEGLPADSPTSSSFRVLTVWGKARGALLGLALAGALLALFHFFAPAGIATVATSKFGFAVVLAVGYVVGEYAIAPRLAKHMLVAAPDGLYASVPSRRFPRFIPWHEIRDFTVTETKPRSFQLASGGRRRAEPGRRVTVWTPEASYSFECSEIENEHHLAVIVRQRLRA